MRDADGDSDSDGDDNDDDDDKSRKNCYILFEPYRYEIRQEGSLYDLQEATSCNQFPSKQVSTF